MEIDLVFKGEKASYELASGLGKFAVTLVQALKDGIRPLQDLVILTTAAVSDLVPVAGDISQLGTEFSENKEAFMNSWLKAGEEVFEGLTQVQAKK
jgi:hypothetical protein